MFFVGGFFWCSNLKQKIFLASIMIFEGNLDLVCKKVHIHVYTEDDILYVIFRRTAEQIEANNFWKVSISLWINLGRMNWLSASKLAASVSLFFKTPTTYRHNQTSQTFHFNKKDKSKSIEAKWNDFFYCWCCILIKFLSIKHAITIIMA